MSQSMLQNALIAAAIGGVGLVTYVVVNRHVPQEVAAVSSQAEASPEGEFVTIFQTPPSATPQTLTLTADDLPSETTVLILPPPPPPPPAEVETPIAIATLPAEVPEPVAPVASVAAEETVAVAALPSEDTAPAERPAQPEDAAASPVEAEVPAQVAATAILRPDAPPEVTATARSDASVRSGVTLASISYADEGLVTLAGLGTAGSTLRVYVDDAFARDGVVEDDGRWALQLDDVAAGVYRLRIDEVRSDGTVASRVETPFQRDIPAIPLGEATAPATPGSVTVQPGNNLWTLARVHYGEGILYSQIFTANTDLIRDPDLIYPGQILALPEVDSTAPANLSASGLPLPRP